MIYEGVLCISCDVGVWVKCGIVFIHNSKFALKTIT